MPLDYCNELWKGRQVLGNDRYLPPKRSGGGEGRHPTACMREIGGLGESIQFLDLLFYYKRYITTTEGKCQGVFRTKVLIFHMRIFVGCVVKCSTGCSIGYCTTCGGAQEIFLLLALQPAAAKPATKIDTRKRRIDIWQMLNRFEGGCKASNKITER